MEMFNNPNKDASLEGIIFNNILPNTVKKCSYIMPYDRLFNGIKSYASNSNIGDNISLRIYAPIVENADPENVNHWQLYKKLSKNWYVIPNYPCEVMLYPAEPKAGVKIEFEYINVGANEVTFFVNAFMHRELNEHIGEDW